MIVFLHGVPGDRLALWDKVPAAVSTASRWPSPCPGFGCARPDGFGATRTTTWPGWPVSSSNSGSQSISVGRDWGAGIDYRLAPRTVRCCVRGWLTSPTCCTPTTSGTTSPRSGRRPVRESSSSPTSWLLRSVIRPVCSRCGGVPRRRALALAGEADETMASCILDLYRSAVPNPYHDWGTSAGPRRYPGWSSIPPTTRSVTPRSPDRWPRCSALPTPRSKGPGTGGRCKHRTPGRS